MLKFNAGMLFFPLAILLAVPACAKEKTDAKKSVARDAADSRLKLATFAGGCFWCMEGPFDTLPGVHETISGYCGGTAVDPSYEEVTTGGTGHAESVQVSFDPEKITYRKLLDVFWRNIDPTVKDRQFADVGTQYRTAIFYHDEEQRKQAEESKAALEKTGIHGGPIVTEISRAGPFYPAEEHHQDYYRKNPVRYKLYRKGSGREGYLKRIWKSRGGKS